MVGEGDDGSGRPVGLGRSRWMVMSLGVIAGFAVTYPVNLWMVARGMKHGLMTERPGTDAAGSKGEEKRRSPGAMGSMPGMAHSSPKGADAGGGKAAEAGRMQSDVTRPQLAAVVGFTSLMLFFGMALPSAFVNLTIRSHEARSAIMPRGVVMHSDTPAAASRTTSPTTTPSSTAAAD